jgi:hypothetical protein
MSLVLAAHCGRFVIVATDTRTVWWDPGSRTIRRARDGYRKIHQTSAGLVVGAGMTELSEAVIARIPEAPDFEALLAIIDQEQRAFTSVRSSPTGWILTTQIGTNLTSAIYHETFGHTFFAFEPGQVSAWVPPGGPEVDATEARIYERLTANVRVYESDGEAQLADAIPAQIRLMRQALADADGLPMVSRDALIGIHTDTGHVSIHNCPPLRRGI